MNKDEEYFLLTVAAEASESNAAARKVILRIADQHLTGTQPRVWMTLRLAESIYTGDSRAQETIVLGSVVGVKADAARIRRVLETIARGLHFLDLGVPAPPTANSVIECSPARWPDPLLAAAVHTIGPEFRYRGHYDGASSLWALEFYETFRATVLLG